MAKAMINPLFWNSWKNVVGKPILLNRVTKGVCGEGIATSTVNAGFTFIPTKIKIEAYTAKLGSGSWMSSINFSLEVRNVKTQGWEKIGSFNADNIGNWISRTIDIKTDKQYDQIRAKSGSFSSNVCFDVGVGGAILEYKRK